MGTEGTDPSAATAKQSTATKLKRVVTIAGHSALNNATSLIALLISLISLRLSYSERNKSEQREMLATTMSSELSGVQHALVTYAHKRPFDAPCLRLPIRLFVMNSSSLPLSITNLWVSFDSGPLEHRPFVDLARVRETDGRPLAWPHTIAPWSTIGFDVTVEMPLPPAVAKALGAPPSRNPIDVGRASELWTRLAQRSGHGVDSLFNHLRRTVTFDLRLLSAAPGHPMHLPYEVALP
jgi:hypothetical protein